MNQKRDIKLRKKRFWALFLVMLMLLNLFPASVFAESIAFGKLDLSSNVEAKKGAHIKPGEVISWSTKTNSGEGPNDAAARFNFKFDSNNSKEFSAAGSLIDGTMSDYSYTYTIPGSSAFSDLAITDSRKDVAEWVVTDIIFDPYRSAGANISYFEFSPLYSVSFVDDDGTPFSSASGLFAYNTPKSDVEAIKPVGKNKTDDHYSYTFTGWDKEITNVTGNTVYTAQYDKTALTSHTIKFVNYDNTLIDSGSYPYGTPAADIVKPTDPTRGDSTESTFTFAGWNPAIADVTGDATYTATYTPSPRKYAITWVDGDGNTLKTDQVEYGKTPSYTGATPTKTADNTNTYSFNNTWSPTIVPVVGPQTYTAQFDSSAIDYTVTFNKNGHGGTAPANQTLHYGDLVTKPDDMSETGYTFGGWYTSADCKTDEAWDFATKTIQGNTELFAKWTINKYNITWKDGDDKVLKTDQVEHGQLPSYTGDKPTKTEDDTYTYTFLDTWTPNITTAIKDETYTAQFTGVYKDYTVTFNKNGHGGDAPASKTLHYGDKIQKPDDMSETGYTFGGWYKSSACLATEAWTFDTDTIKGNTELFAKWTAIEYAITWKDGDNKTLKVDQVAYGQTPSYTGATPTKTADKTNTYSFNNTWDPAIVPVVGEQTYTAQFTPTKINYTVTFNINGHGGTAPSDQTLNYGDKVTKPSDLSETGYTFGGWYTSADCKDEEKWTFDTDTIQGNTELFAKWTAIEYAITWVDGDGKTLKVDQVAYGKTPSYTGATPTKTADKTNTYSFNNTWDPAIVPVVGEQTYTAQFTPTKINYTVTFNINGHGGTAPSDQTLNYGDKVTKPSDLSETGYTFGGWYTSADCKDTEKWTFDTDTIQGNTELFAKWTAIEYDITWKDGDNKTLKVDQVAYGKTPSYTGATPTKTADNTYTYSFNNTWDKPIVPVSGNETYTAQFDSHYINYTVTFNKNGHGGKAPDSQSLHYESLVADPGAMSETGYTFGGWYTSSDCKDTEVWNFATDKIKGNTELFAKWTINQYDITWKDGDDKELKTDKVDYGLTPSYSGETPTKTEDNTYTYTFLNTWTPNITTVTGNATYTAEFTGVYKEYTVTFNKNGYGGTAPSNQTLHYEDKIQKPADMSETGYTFGGWYTSADCKDTEKWNFTTDKIKGNTELFAKWTVNQYDITWKDGDGKTLKVDKVDFGKTPSYTGATPTKTADKTYTYSFNNKWSPAIVPVVGAQTYTAQFDPTYIEYTVSFNKNSHGGTAPSVQTLHYGDKVTKPTDMSETGYTFGGWYTSADCKDNEAWDFTTDTIQGDTELFAKWTVIEYDITWVDGDGKNLKVDKVAFSQTPSYSGTTPTKTADNTYTYSFKNSWTPTIVPVSGNATYTAEFTPVYINYTVTFNKNGHGGTAPAAQSLHYEDKIQKPTDMSETGYTFGGWYTSADCKDTEVWTFATDKIKGNTELFAKWTINQYDITWKDGDDKELKTDKVDYGLTPSYSGETPTKTEDNTYTYTFLNTWTPNITTVTGNATYTAEFTGVYKEYTVTFNKNGYGGTAPSNQTLHYEDKIQKPADMSETGYTFGGWYTSADCKDTEKWNFTTDKIKGNTELFAKWTVNQYDITWKDGDGKNLKVDKVAFGQTPSYSGTTPTKTADETYTYSFNNTWDPAIVTVSGPKTYTAQFDQHFIDYTVSFNKNGHGGTAPSDQSLHYGDKVTKPTDMSETGYTFGGWYTSADCKDNEAWDFTTDTIQGNTELFAKWTVNLYDITWKDGDGKNLKVDKVAFGQTPSYSGTTPTKTADETYTYSFKNSWTPAIVSVSGNATYTAEFTPVYIDYTVTFNKNGHGGTAPAAQSLHYGDKVTKPSDMSETGYNFGGWYTSADCKDSEVWTFAADTIQGNTELFAKWTPIKYDITWKDGDDKVLKTDKVDYGLTPSYSGTTPTKTEDNTYTYTFLNTWTPNITTVTGNATYTAQFRGVFKEYTVTFNKNGHGGTAPADQTLHYEDKIQKPADMSETGYTFGGWYTSADCKDAEVWNFATDKIKGNIELFAKWTINQYKITFVDDDGKTVLQQETEYDFGTAAGSIVQPQTPTKKWTDKYKYTFDGWSPAVEQVTKDQKYTATYKEEIRSYNIRFLDEDDSVLSGPTLYEYDTPAGSINEPNVTVPAKYSGHYHFTGWTPEVSAVKGDADYKATYAPNNYHITFVGKDGVLAEADYVYNTKAADIVVPDATVADTAEYIYTFTGWDKQITDVVGDETYTAKYDVQKQKYKVTFVDDDGTVLKEATEYDFGTKAADIVRPADPSKAETDECSYSFGGWTPEVTDVGTKDVTYTATYTKKIKEYKVTWKDGDGKVLKTDSVKYNEMPSYSGDTPTKKATADTRFKFNNKWTPEIVKVTGDATYTAEFDASKIVMHTLSFDLNGGTLNGKTGTVTIEAEEGTEITIPDAPTREGYKFTYWKGSEYHPGDKYKVEGDHTFTAQWEEIKKETTEQPTTEAPKPAEQPTTEAPKPAEQPTTEAPKPAAPIAVQTGDNVNILLLIVLMAISLLGIISILVLKKKQRYN